jgi:single-stranded-DNA-specific exonuclease
MITIDNGIGKGSARSIAGFDLHSALKKCADLFVQFGGHKYAAGLTIEEKNIPEFKKRFNKICSELLSVADQVRIIEIDDEIDIEDVDFELIRLINTLAPFGPRNACPLFVSYNLDVVGEPRIVGNNHLKFRVGKNGKVFDVIAFNLGDAIEQLREKRKVDIVYNIEENKWMDRNTIQFKVKDLR